MSCALGKTVREAEATRDCLVRFAGFLQRSENEGLNFVDIFWRSLLRTLDPGTMGGDTGTVGGLKIDLSRLFGGDAGDALTAAERKQDQTGNALAGKCDQRNEQ